MSRDMTGVETMGLELPTSGITIRRSRQMSFGHHGRCQNVGVLERPETREAHTPLGDSIAFQVCGRGELDVVYVPNWASPTDLIWDHPLPARFLARLARSLD